MKLAHIDTKDLKFEKVTEREHEILQCPYFTENCYGRESVGYVCSAQSLGEKIFDLIATMNSFREEYGSDSGKYCGTGRYCHDNEDELRYEPVNVAKLLAALQTEEGMPLKGEKALRSFCDSHPEFRTEDDIYLFKITDDNPDKRGYSKDSRYEGCVNFFRIKLPDDNSNMFLRVDSFVSDLLYPYMEQADRGIPLYDRGGAEKCRLINGSEIQLSDDNGSKLYTCFLYDTRSLYDIDNGVRADKLVRFSEDEYPDVIEKNGVSLELKGKPFSCERFLADVDARERKNVSIRKSTVIPKDRIVREPVLVQAPLYAVTEFVSKAGKEMIRVQVPNDDPRDRRYKRTFVVSKNDKFKNSLIHYHVDGEHVNIPLAPGRKIELTRSEKNGSDYKHETTICTPEELKEKLSKKTNVQHEVSRNTEVVRHMPRRDNIPAEKFSNSIE